MLALAAGSMAAIAAGAAVAWFITGSAQTIEGRGPGPWSTAASIGDSSAGMLTRATVARTGLWALPPSEVIYFLTDRDDAGRPLDARCTYELKGRSDLPARWWSISAYVDYHFVDNAQSRYSYTKTNVAQDTDGRYTIRVSRTPQPGNWLPLGDKPGKVHLLTRLYQPDPARTAVPEHVPLAKITRLACA